MTSAPQPTHYPTLAGLQALVGQTLGESAPLVIDQARIDLFAQATGDHQWIHTDPARAAAGPFGATVAHGFLTLSLLPLLTESAFAIDDVRLGINYGLNRVRFPAPVRVGSAVAARLVLLDYEPLPTPDGRPAAQLTVQATLLVPGQDKPVCVAESVSRRYT
jgi:acyl dehydratase